MNKYEIKEIKDFLQVPPDKIGICLKDFAQYLEMVRAFTTIADVLDSPIESHGFTWVDDGIEGVSSVRLHDIEAGEMVQEFKL